MFLLNHFQHVCLPAPPFFVIRASPRARPQSMGVIAHPGAVSACALAADGKFMLTAGGADRSGSY